MSKKKHEVHPEYVNKKNNSIKSNWLLWVHGFLLYMMNVTSSMTLYPSKNDSKHDGHSPDVFTLPLCKNMVRICLSWLLSCAANLQSYDLVDLKCHHHYSWLPEGGTEWNFYSAPESLLSLREKKINAILHPILSSVPIFLHPLPPASLPNPPILICSLCLWPMKTLSPLLHRLPTSSGSVASQTSHHSLLPSSLPPSFLHPRPTLTGPQPESTFIYLCFGGNIKTAVIYMLRERADMWTTQRSRVPCFLLPRESRM